RHVGERIALPAHAADLLVVMGVAVGADVETGGFLRAQMRRDRVLVLLAVARVEHGFEEALGAEGGVVPGRAGQRADDRGRQHDAGGCFVHGDFLWAVAVARTERSVIWDFRSPHSASLHAATCLTRTQRQQKQMSSMGRCPRVNTLGAATSITYSCIDPP